MVTTMDDSMIITTMDRHSSEFGVSDYPFHLLTVRVHPSANVSHCISALYVVNCSLLSVRKQAKLSDSRSVGNWFEMNDNLVSRLLLELSVMVVMWNVICQITGVWHQVEKYNCKIYCNKQ